MANLPTYEEIAKMAKELAEKALDEYVYKDKTLREWINIIDKFDFDIDKAAEALLEQTRWIPTSKRLPEVYGSNDEFSDNVLICVADDERMVISTGFYGYYPKNKALQGWWSMWAYGCHQLDSKYKVVAWMPLPLPYREEEV